MTQTGQKLGAEVLRVAKTIEPKVPEHPELQFSLETRHFKPRYDIDAMLAAVKPMLKPAVYEHYRSLLTTPLDCPVTSLLINRQIALIGLPGEPFVEFGIDFRDRSPASFNLFAGYANGYFGYFPTIRAASQGGYGAEGLVSRAEVGAGELMVNTGLIQLYRMLGLMK
jgi:hypothetical protein